MFAALLIYLILPIADTSRIRGNQFRPIMKAAFWVQVVVFGILMWIGSQHPVEPFVLIGQIATTLYFAWFVIFVPFIGILENSLFDVGLMNSKNN
jgi:quinol-cytochrome oxidoreductase complex cytochrome b subunit